MTSVRDKSKAKGLVLITGTPGTGKTAVSKILVRRLGIGLLHLNKAIIKKKLYSGYDKKRKTHIVDQKKINSFVRKWVKENKTGIIESHLAHELPPGLVRLVIVLRCDPEVLRRRLESKGWNKRKTEENVEAEIIGLIAYEARKRHGKIVEVNTTRKKPVEVARKIERLLKHAAQNRS